MNERIPYTETIVPLPMVMIYNRVRARVDDFWRNLAQTTTMPENPVSSHMVARAVAALEPSLRSVCGYFGPFRHEHEWLVVKDELMAQSEGCAAHSLCRDSWIFDVYPIGVAAPRAALLINGGALSPWRTFYREEPDVIARVAERRHNPEKDIELVTRIMEGKQ